ncbi:MAG: hypothetical protein EOM22_00210 [Gammaproteobacteria bacterium]|nr:hypothetical protein [Gammaproteobacteria bacterium]
MSEWFRHDAFGRITTIGSCPDGDEHYYEYADETLVIGVQADPHRQWYNADARRLEFRATPIIGADGHTLTSIPTPCALEVTGPVRMSTLVHDDTLELSFDVPGTYTLRFEPAHPQWTEAVVTIEVAA